MLKTRLSLFLFIITVRVFSQSEIYIDGKIRDNIKDNDTVYFSHSDLNINYYETSLLSSAIQNNNFYLKGKFSYPQLFFLNLKSEKDRIPRRAGKYFIDRTTRSIKVDSLIQNIEVIGESGFEYKNKFAPYFLEKNPKEILEVYRNNNPKEFDSKLLSYVFKNPNSYVALWNLIERFNLNGYSEIYVKTLNSFSDKIKKGKLWKVLYNDIKQTRIRENEKFPELALKNVGLANEKLILPKAKYVFIDFWFSRCKPCLAQMPMLKKLYDKYRFQGFEIISIATDRTKYIETWKKRIGEYELPWKNYLDENATESDKEKIFSFPTNFLISQKGKVLKKNIKLEDLERLLEENLKE